MATDTTTRLTYDDLVQLPDDGRRYEIIDGELFVNAAPVPRHQMIVGNLYFELATFFRRNGGGMVYLSPLDVVFDELNVTEPDVVVISSDRAGIVGKKNVQGAPSLCIEVLSDSTRRLDEIHKRKLYERSGVDEYWIVDPVLEIVKVYRRGPSGYERAAEVSTESGGAITTPLFRALSVDVTAVFTSPWSEA
ncbi:MAG TPA: Uma2 family endonuclease [Thermoanaerobaculia bacterium]|jgi:Uma2 family endonuclease